MIGVKPAPLPFGDVLCDLSAGVVFIFKSYCLLAKAICGTLLAHMAKEFFAHPETRQLFQTIEEISRRSAVSRGQAFEDVIRASVAALAAETMEPQYFEAIKAHTKGEKGKRGVDLFPVFFGQTVDAISKTDNDVLGDLFQGGISYGENGLYLTPQPIAELMARLSPEDKNAEEDRRSAMISDPCCGTGILLMESGKLNPRAELIGQDIDARCARVTAINLGLRGKYGWVICGNTLSREVQFVYRIGSFFHEGPNGRRRGVIRSVPPEQCPVLPEITQLTRQNLLDQVDRQQPEGSADQSLPEIIEVPQWAFRLEQRLTTSGGPPTTKSDTSMQPTEVEQSAEPSSKESINSPTSSTVSQKRLFDEN